MIQTVSYACCAWRVIDVCFFLNFWFIVPIGVSLSVKQYICVFYYLLYVKGLISMEVIEKSEPR